MQRTGTSSLPQSGVLLQQSDSVSHGTDTLTLVSYTGALTASNFVFA